MARNRDILVHCEHDIAVLRLHVLDTQRDGAKHLVIALERTLDFMRVLAGGLPRCWLMLGVH
jgi:hypothetical protein